MTGTKVEAVHHHGVDALERFVIGTGARGRPAPRRRPPQRVPGRRGRRRPAADRVRGAQRRRRADRGRRAPGRRDARRHEARRGQAARRGVQRDDPGRGRARDRHRARGHHGPRRRRSSRGRRWRGVLPIATDVLELEVTPNRPDCLAVYGVAREVHAATGAPLAPPPWARGPRARAGEIAGVEVVVEAPDLCPRFTARAFEDVTIGPSPPWLKARLMAAGQRPINNVVDITNYVMLLVGSPLHAFDLDRVAGGRLVVRRAKDGEQVTTLDGQVRTLDAQMLVIDDADGPTSIAGVMGGERSEVHEGTTRVLMEVANWDGPNIHRTSQLLGLRSEASGRFEKGLAPEQAMEAADRRHAAHARADRRAARARDDRRRRRRARPASSSACASTASRRSSGGRSRARARPRSCARWSSASRRRPGGLEVLVPAFRRNDVTREADLIEEVARIDGLEKLPATLPKRRGSAGRLSVAAAPAPPRDRRARRPRHVRDRGLELHRARAGRPPAPGPRRPAPALRGPREPDERGPHGAAHDAPRLAARRRAPQRRARPARPRALRGRHRLPRRRRPAARTSTARWPACSSAACTRRRGDTPSRRARASSPPRACSAPRSTPCACAGTSSPRPSRSCIPGAARACWPAARTSGWIGELHPLVARAWDLDHGAALFEVDLDRVLGHADAVPHYVDLTSFPALRHGPLGHAGRRRRRPRPCWPPCARRAASCWPACASSTSTAASRWGRGASRSRSRSPSARPTAR